MSKQRTDGTAALEGHQWIDGYGLYLCFQTFDQQVLDRIKERLEAATALLEWDGIHMYRWKTPALLFLDGDAQQSGKVTLNVGLFIRGHAMNSEECNCPNDDYHVRMFGGEEGS